MANPRLMLETKLSAGAQIALNEAQARHVGTVLRLDAGDAIRVFNAADGEWSARVVEKTKRGMNVRVEGFLRRPRAAPDVDLLFAPVKRHATDLIVEKATELGVRRIRPVITQRTIAETVRLDRLRSIAREAAEQTERFDAPEILEPLSLAKALDGWDAARAVVFADEAGDDAREPWGGARGRAQPIYEAVRTARPYPHRGDGGVGGRTSAHSPSGPKAEATGAHDADINGALRPLAQPPPQGAGALALLIGPEGGFTQEERRMLRGLPYVIPVSLGPRILRAETAVIAALSVLQSVWGDWRNP